MNDLTDMAVEYHRQYVESDHQFWENMGVSTSAISKHMLGWIVDPIIEEHERWKGADLVPYMTADGRVMHIRMSAITFDRTNDPTMMMLESVDKPPKPRIWNVGNTLPGLRTNQVVVVHDVLSGLLLRSHGFRAVALPCDEWEDAWRLLFSHADVVHVVNSRSAYEHWHEYWKKNRMRARVVRVEAESLADLGFSETEKYEQLLGVSP